MKIQKKIRTSIKKSITKSKLIEIPSRKLAIYKAVLNSKSDEILIIAGKGHENIQEYKNKKNFSDKNIITKSIFLKNKSLSNDWKLNIFRELISDKKLNNLKKFKISTNSKDINRNKIFFWYKGKFF